MKSEHRHELKTNDLAEWIANFPQWVKKKLTMIIYVSIVVIVALGAFFYNHYQKTVVKADKQANLTKLISNIPLNKMNVIQYQTQDMDYSFTMIQIAKSLEEAAENESNNRVAALAIIKTAEVLRSELHYRLENPTEQEIAQQIAKAKASYNDALIKAKGDTQLTAMAKLGLGLCEEEIGNFEGAEKIYNELTTNPDFESSTAAAQAQHRLKIMDNFKEKTIFCAAPKKSPVEPIIEKPQLQFEPSDSNLANQ